MSIKTFSIVSLLVLLFGIVITIFWQQELRYQLPTPVPQEYRAVLPRQPIDLTAYLAQPFARPVLLHFFSADCPCSRFNIDHFGYLVSRYRDSVDFYVVLPGDNTSRAAARFQEQYDLSLPVLVDHDEQLAEACGVYATPQAVIIDQQSQLYYRGNYNRARYCTAKGTSYAELAIKALKRQAPPPVFAELATQSYGCQLPSQRDSSWFSF